MGKQNPYGAKSPPEPVEVRCTVCGNEWETIAEYPQCHDPETTEVSCGRSREWEYVNPEDDPETESESEPDNVDNPDDSDGQTNGSDSSPESGEDLVESPDLVESDNDGDSNENGGSSEPEDSGGEETGQSDADRSGQENERDSDDQMVTQEEYDRFHGEEPSGDSSRTRARDNESGDTVDDESGSGGIPLPVDRDVLLIGAVAIVGLAAIYFLIIKPRSESSGSSTETTEADSGQDLTETTKSADGQEMSVESSDPSASEPDPAESAQMVEPRSPNEVPLFEGE